MTALDITILTSKSFKNKFKRERSQSKMAGKNSFLEKK
jgi:hypothetical protein